MDIKLYQLMKRLSFILLLVCCGFGIKAQSANTSEVAKFPILDASPLDVVYFPLNTSKSKKLVKPIIRVLYSRPQKKGRQIFGVLEQYDKVWRLGANESTEIEFFKPVRIAGRKINAGRYSLFAIPKSEKWTFIVNKQTDKWGAFSYDERKDVVRVDVPIENLEKVIDVFSMTFKNTPEGANLVMAWDKTQVVLPIAFKN